MLDNFSTQPPLQFGWVSRAVEDRNYSDKIGFDPEKDAVFIERLNRGLSNCFAPERKSFRVCQNTLDGGFDFGREPITQARLALIVPRDCVLKFKPCFEVELYFAALSRFLSLSGSSARICSHGIPFSGLRLNRSARRSASSICSVVKPSLSAPNSSRTRPATSRRSFSGRHRICSKISVALTSVFYRGALFLQENISDSASSSLILNPFLSHDPSRNT